MLGSVRDAEVTAVRAALEANAWVLRRAAKSLGISLHGIQTAIARHPALAAEVRRRGRKPGRPSKVVASGVEVRPSKRRQQETPSGVIIPRKRDRKSPASVRGVTGRRRKT